MFTYIDIQPPPCNYLNAPVNDDNEKIHNSPEIVAFIIIII